MNTEKGYVSFILHAHLPFIHHPESEDYLEEEWLFEAISETYIPLLLNFKKLEEEKVQFRLTMSITPPLLSMLDNKLLQRRYIKYLKKLIDETVPFHSIIVFSERCTLKKIDVESPDIFVIKRDDVKKTVSSINDRAGLLLSQNRVDELYAQLFPFTQVTEEVKVKHVADINNVHTEQRIVQSDQREADEKNYVCPRCGGKLVRRTAKRGTYEGNQFYGCTNFPKCRYTKQQ